MSDQKVIHTVSTNFVPVAVNLYKARQAKDEGGELFHSIQRQKDQYQGIWIVSPAGKVLAGHHDFKSRETWTQEVLETANAAMKAFGPLPPRRAKPTKRLPFRGQGVQDDGAISLAIYARQMLGGGRLRAPASVPASRLWLWDGEDRPDGPVTIDSLTLTANERATFVPPKTDVGTTWALPETVCRQFCRVLIPSSDQSSMPLPADAKIARLNGTVESLENGLARIRLTGAWEAVHLQEGDTKRPIRGAATAEGFAVYDVKEQSIRSILILFSGIYGPPNDEAICAAGAVVEWQR